MRSTLKMNLAQSLPMLAVVAAGAMLHVHGAHAADPAASPAQLEIRIQVDVAPDSANLSRWLRQNTRRIIAQRAARAPREDSPATDAVQRRLREGARTKDRAAARRRATAGRQAASPPRSPMARPATPHARPPAPPAIRRAQAKPQERARPADAERLKDLLRKGRTRRRGALDEALRRELRQRERERQRQPQGVPHRGGGGSSQSHQGR